MLVEPKKFFWLSQTQKRNQNRLKMDQTDRKSIWIKTKYVSQCSLTPPNAFKQKQCRVFVDKLNRKPQPQFEAKLILIPPPMYVKT